MQKIIIARQKDDRNANYLSSEEYVTSRLSYAEMIARGEPFILANRMPLIHAFGPGTHWKMQTRDFLVYGEAIDPEDFDEVESVLEMRRQGDIYGRWHSRFALEGDTGFQSYLRVEPISAAEYMLFMHHLENL